MRFVFKWICYIALWPACFAGVAALSNVIFDTHESLWVAAVLGALTGIGTVFMLENERRGWIRGLIWDPAAKARLTQRRKDLAEQREQIIAEAKERRGA